MIALNRQDCPATGLALPRHRLRPAAIRVTSLRKFANRTSTLAVREVHWGHHQYEVLCRGDEECAV